MKTRIQNRRIKHRISRRKYGKRRGGDPIDEDVQISSTVRNKPTASSKWKNRTRAIRKVFNIPLWPKSLWPKRDAKIGMKENNLDVSSTISDTDLTESSLGSSEGKIIFNPLYKSSGEKGGKRKKYKRTKTRKIKK
jgi:hypothetical protein